MIIDDFESQWLQKDAAHSDKSFIPQETAPICLSVHETQKENQLTNPSTFRNNDLFMGQDQDEIDVTENMGPSERVPLSVIPANAGNSFTAWISDSMQFMRRADSTPTKADKGVEKLNSDRKEETKATEARNTDKPTALTSFAAAAVLTRARSASMNKSNAPYNQSKSTSPLSQGSVQSPVNQGNSRFWPPFRDNGRRKSQSMAVLEGIMDENDEAMSSPDLDDEATLNSMDTRSLLAGQSIRTPTSQDMDMDDYHPRVLAYQPNISSFSLTDLSMSQNVQGDVYGDTPKGLLSPIQQIALADVRQSNRARSKSDVNPAQLFESLPSSSRSVLDGFQPFSMHMSNVPLLQPTTTEYNFGHNYRDPSLASNARRKGSIATLSSVARSISNASDDSVSIASASSSKYTCSHCGKGFNRPSTLKIHSFSHTGEKNFHCSCGKAFSTHSNLKRHRRIHSSDANVSMEGESTDTNTIHRWKDYANTIDKSPSHLASN